MYLTDFYGVKLRETWSMLGRFCGKEGWVGENSETGFEIPDLKLTYGGDDYL